jgi:hypothetical protein
MFSGSPPTTGKPGDCTNRTDSHYWIGHKCGDPITVRQLLLASNLLQKTAKSCGTGSKNKRSKYWKHTAYSPTIKAVSSTPHEKEIRKWSAITATTN